jgi:hypothetical protein
MNGYPDQQPSINLPPVKTEAATVVGKAPEASPVVPEQAPSKEGNNSGAIQAAPVLPILPVTAGPTPNPSPINTVAPMLNSNITMKNDSDLIPKEWVIKAKTIIERTREDPYSQNQALTKMKADYIKERYNMSIKVDDE